MGRSSRIVIAVILIAIAIFDIAAAGFASLVGDFLDAGVTLLFLVAGEMSFALWAPASLFQWKIKEEDRRGFIRIVIALWIGFLVVLGINLAVK